MANVTDNEERYLRQILLLGKGGCLVLRALVNREKNKDGRSLEDILKNSNTKLKKCLQNFQYDCIFPSATDVNADIETWDISLLISILLNVFGHVTLVETNALNKIREIRNEIQGHHPSYSLTEEDYNELRLELNENILKLASDKTTKIKCDKIMSYSGAGQLTNDIVLKELNALHAFEGDQLFHLNKRFGESKSKLQCIGEAVTDVKTVLNTVIENQHEHKEELAKQVNDVHVTALSSQEDLVGIKGNTRAIEINQQEHQEKLNNQLQVIDAGVQLSKQDLTEIKGGILEIASSSRENDEQKTEILRRIEQMLEQLSSQHSGQPVDVDANINMNSERSENATEAQGIIITSINDILKEIRNVMEDQDNKETLMPKINELLLREEGREHELTKALLELIKDIIQHGHIQQARKGSIKLTVRFTSYSKLLRFLQYLSSEQFQDRLNNICRAFENRTGHVVTLSGNIAQESLNDLHQHLEDECNNLGSTRSVVLPVQCKGILDLNHIWKLLQRSGADIHMKRLSEILTKIVGGKVTLTTSVNLKQFEQALLKIESGHSSSHESLSDNAEHIEIPENDCSNVADANKRFSTAGQKVLESSEEIKKTNLELDMQQKEGIEKFEVESESCVKQVKATTEEKVDKMEVEAEYRVKTIEESTDKGNEMKQIIPSPEGGVDKLEFETESGLKQKEESTNSGDDEMEVEAESRVEQIIESTNQSVDKLEYQPESLMDEMSAKADEPLMQIKKSTTAIMEDANIMFKEEIRTVIDSAKRRIIEEADEGVKKLKSELNAGVTKITEALTANKDVAYNKLKEDERIYHPYAYYLYRKALEDGFVEESSIRVNVVGNFGQGKTCLVERLIRSDIGGTKSTNGIDIAHYKCKKRAYSNITYDNSPSNKADVKRTSNIQGSSDCIYNKLDIWDFSGQCVFYSTHTLFHNRKAIYLLVFNLSCGLTDIVPNEEICSVGDRTMEYYIKFLVNSIHSCVGSKDGSDPKIILVGTHFHSLKGDDESKNRQAKKYFDDVRALFKGKQQLNHIVEEHFALDNRNFKDTAFDELREQINRHGKKYATSTKIPEKWIQLEKSLLNHNQKKIIEFEMIVDIDSTNESSLGTPDQIKMFLKHKHDQGTLFYFDEEPISKYVVLDPEFVVDAFKRIIFSDRFIRNEVNESWLKLKKEGKLEMLLVENVWGKDPDEQFMTHKNTLLLLLQKHHIISEVSRFDEQKEKSVGLGWYVVPSLLKDHCNVSEMKCFFAGKKQTQMKFVISFDNSSIVPTIYHRLTAAILEKWSIQTFRSNNLLFKSMSIVRLDVQHAGITEMNDSHIQLAVLNLCPSSNVNKMLPDAFRRFVEKVIAYEFGIYQGTAKQNYMPYKRGYICNHEIHNGVCNQIVIPYKQLENPIVPCPEAESHDINADGVNTEWFQGDERPKCISKETMSDETLSRLTQVIGHNWELLGPLLGLKQILIDRIIEEYHNTCMKIYAMLLYWHDTSRDGASLYELVNLLQRCPSISVDWDEMRNIAEELNEHEHLKETMNKGNRANCGSPW